MARTLSASELDAVAELARWLEASGLQANSSDQLHVLCREVLRSALAWLSGGAAIHVIRVTELLPDRHSRVLACSCLQEFTKRELPPDRIARRHYRELAELLEALFGLEPATGGLAPTLLPEPAAGEAGPVSPPKPEQRAYESGFNRSLGETDAPVEPGRFDPT